MEAVLKIDAMVVFEGVARGVTEIVERFAEAGAWIPGKKTRKIGERQLSAEVLTQGLLPNAGAAKLVAKLHVVPAELPGDVVNEVPVGVHAAARNRGRRAELCETAHDDDRQARICRALPRARSCCTGSAEPDRTGVKALVLREESFRKPVPAHSHLVDKRRSDDVHIGQ